jgi:hypothetical protein
MRTQNPPPLKACRFDSDLGHHVNFRLCALTALCAQRRSGLSIRISLIALAKAVTHSFHIKSAADDPEVGTRERDQSMLRGKGLSSSAAFPCLEPGGGRRSRSYASFSETQVYNPNWTPLDSEIDEPIIRTGRSQDPE